jgi:hypothetical protein
VSDSCCGQVETATSLKKASEIAKNHADRHAIEHDNTTTVVTVFDVMARRDCQDTWEFPIANALNCPQCVADKLISLGELIRHDESRTDEKLRQMIAATDAEADRDDGREPGDTRDEESLEDHQIQGLGAFRDVFDAGSEQ